MQCIPSCGPQDKDEVGTDGKLTNKKINGMLKAWKREEEKVVKVLLLGTGESGKSTVTKQMKIIHINGFSESEKLERVRDIRKNIRDSILTILGAMSYLNVPLGDGNLQNSLDYLMENAVVDDYHYPQEFYSHTERLWQDSGVQECFQRSNEYQLIDSAKYFLEKISDVRKDDYIPTEQDILRCRVMTNAIQQIDYLVKDNKVDVKFSVFDVGGQQGERRKWMQLFDACTAILFIVDCSSYDLCLREDTNKNRLLEAMEIFDQVWNSRFLRYISVILFINKIDILEEKVTNGKTLDQFVENINPESKYHDLFEDYKTYEKPKEAEKREFIDAFPRREHPHNLTNNKTHTSTPGNFKKKSSQRSASLRPDIDDEVVKTAVFVKRAFMKLKDRPRQDEYGVNWHSDHTCEYYYTCAVDTNNIRKVLEGCRTVIIKRHLGRWGISL